VGDTIAHISVRNAYHLGERLASVAYIWLQITIFYIAGVHGRLELASKSFETCRHPKTKYEMKWEACHL